METVQVVDRCGFCSRRVIISLLFISEAFFRENNTEGKEDEPEKLLGFFFLFGIVI